MSEQSGSAQPKGPVAGQMFLYERPELLTPEEHGSLGYTPLAHPYAFARTARAIPVVMSEMVSAQRHYPIVFTDLEDPGPVAVVGLQDDENLFVDADGLWDGEAYVPAHLRCHPFALASAPDERFAVVIDRSSPALVENGRFPLFEGAELSDQTRKMVDFCGKYEGERRRTQAFVKRLRELDLLGIRRATMRRDEGEEQTIARYVSVEPEKLGRLTAEQVHELHGSGMLAAIYAHLFSLENWGRLVVRRERRPAESAAG